MEYAAAIKKSLNYAAHQNMHGAGIHHVKQNKLERDIWCWMIFHCGIERYINESEILNVNKPWDVATNMRLLIVCGKILRQRKDRLK